jgi:hypothetical protein
VDFVELAKLRVEALPMPDYLAGFVPDPDGDAADTNGKMLPPFVSVYKRDTNRAFVGRSERGSECNRLITATITLPLSA